MQLWYGGWALVGSIPSSWGSLRQLEYVGLELNRLSGEYIWYVESELLISSAALSAFHDAVL